MVSEVPASFRELKKKDGDELADNDRIGVWLKLIFRYTTEYTIRNSGCIKLHNKFTR